jgi:hypothetical protein
MQPDMQAAIDMVRSGTLVETVPAVQLPGVI